MKSIVQVVQNLLKPYIDTHRQTAEAIIAPVETNASSASRNYSVGQQLILSDVLYDVSAPITSGDALVVNTNITAASAIGGNVKSASVKADNIEASIAPVETSTTAAAAYSSGDQFMLNGILYEATATINIGDTLTVGTNIKVADDIAIQIADANTAIAGKASTDVIDTEYEEIGSAALYVHNTGTIFYATDGKIYKATSDISVSDTLTVGTNCALTNLVDMTNDKENAPTVLSTTLTAGSTTATFTNAAIKNTSRIRVLTDPFITGLRNAVQSGTTVTLTFEAQASNITVGIEIYN